MFKDILLPIDLGEDPLPEKALATAVALARNDGARLHLLAVVPGYSMSIISQYFPENFEEKALAETSARLHAVIDQEIPDDVTAQAIVANGSAYEEILATAEKIGCDLIVMASHRPGLEAYLLGPNTAKVVRHAKCSVFVVRD